MHLAEQAQRRTSELEEKEEEEDDDDEEEEEEEEKYISPSQLSIQNLNIKVNSITIDRQQRKLHLQRTASHQGSNKNSKHQQSLTPMPHTISHLLTAAGTAYGDHGESQIMSDPAIVDGGVGGSGGSLVRSITDRRNPPSHRASIAVGRSPFASAFPPTSPATRKKLKMNQQSMSSFTALLQKMAANGFISKTNANSVAQLQLYCASADSIKEDV